MNPVYAIMESPHRWWILLSISAGTGILGSIMFVTWGWSHDFARVWLCLGLAIAVYFAVRQFLDWKAAVAAVADASGDGIGEQHPG